MNPKGFHEYRSQMLSSLNQIDSDKYPAGSYDQASSSTGRQISADSAASLSRARVSGLDSMGRSTPYDSLLRSSSSSSTSTISSAEGEPVDLSPEGRTRSLSSEIDLTPADRVKAQSEEVLPRHQSQEVNTNRGGRNALLGASIAFTTVALPTILIAVGSPLSPAHLSKRTDLLQEISTKILSLQQKQKNVNNSYKPLYKDLLGDIGYLNFSHKLETLLLNLLIPIDTKVRS